VFWPDPNKPPQQQLPSPGKMRGEPMRRLKAPQRTHSEARPAVREDTLVTGSLPSQPHLSSPFGRPQELTLLIVFSLKFESCCCGLPRSLLPLSCPCPCSLSCPAHARREHQLGIPPLPSHPPTYRAVSLLTRKPTFDRYLEVRSAPVPWANCCPTPRLRLGPSACPIALSSTDQRLAFR